MPITSLFPWHRYLTPARGPPPWALTHPSSWGEELTGRRGCAHLEPVPFIIGHTLGTQNLRTPCANGHKACTGLFPRFDHHGQTVSSMCTPWGPRRSQGVAVCGECGQSLDVKAGCPQAQSRCLLCVGRRQGWGEKGDGL